MIGFHGFLGLPQDFQFMREFDIHAPSLWELSQLSFDQLADQLIDRFQSESADQVFLGYSMGGRVLLNMLARGLVPRAAVFISTHPGLMSEIERQDRLAADKKWATRFRSDLWQNVLSDWNDQGVLVGPSYVRDERDFSRTQLADGLINWSLAHQQDLRGAVGESKVPLLWICGSDDQKFLKLSQEISGSIEKLILPDCGHRVLLQQPQVLKREVSRWLQQI